jgi:hypothetical protein
MVGQLVDLLIVVELDVAHQLCFLFFVELYQRELLALLFEHVVESVLVIAEVEGDAVGGPAAHIAGIR